MRYRRLQIPGICYFFTLVTHQRRPVFSDSLAIDFYRTSVGRVQSKRAFTLDAEVILPDLIHLLLTLPDGDTDYPTRIRLIKSTFTRLYLQALSHDAERSNSRINKSEQALWQRRYWEHAIRDDSDFQAHLDYIHFNPVKHGLARSAGDWPHSTFKTWIDKGAYDPWWGSDDMPPLPEWAGRE